MKVLVQDSVTLSYYQAPGSWTSDPESAMTFHDSHEAVQFCLEHDWREAQVVLKFEDNQYDVQLPVVHPEARESSGHELVV